MKGSLTVEAAYIFPFCFMVIGIICLLGIFTYNQAVLKMTGYECILQTMEERDMEEEIIRENILRRAKQAAHERTFGIKDLKASVRVTSSKISLSLECVQTMLKVPIKVTVIYERMYPELTLRLTRGIIGE